MLYSPQAAARFDAEVVDRYTRHYAHCLTHCLKQEQVVLQEAEKGEILHAIDLSCGTGSSTLEIVEALPKDYRVVALSSDRFALNEFHKKLSPDKRKQIFPRRERIDRHPFAPKVFDLAWAILDMTHLENPASLIRNAHRILKPGKSFILVTPLQGSFSALVRALATLTLEQSDLVTTLRQAAIGSGRLRALSEWQNLFERVGSWRYQATTYNFKVEAKNPLANDPLLSEHLLGLWFGVRDPHVQTLLSRPLPEALTLDISLGCIVATCQNETLKDSEAIKAAESVALSEHHISAADYTLADEAVFDPTQDETQG